MFRAVIFCCALAASALSASALEVYYHKDTPQNLREWGDRNYLREQMEVVAQKICKALYGETDRSSLHENFKMELFLNPVKGGNPAFAVGRRIVWKVGNNPGDSPGMGLLCHEMTHVLDMGTDRVFTEAMADWTRNYKVWYRGCTDPSAVLHKRYKALRGGRNYGKYMAGANFVDFMTQNYGEGTILKILHGYRQHGRDHWEKTFGKNFDALIDEWRQMETIYDPVFQWTYNGTLKGIVRSDRKFCALNSLHATEAANKKGVWLNGATEGSVNNLNDGNMTIALHGIIPNTPKLVIASLGSARKGNGKAVMLTTGQRKNTLLLSIVATVPGSSCKVVSYKQIPLPDMDLSSHSVVLSVSGGNEAKLVIDGGEATFLAMNGACKGCSFEPSFAIGGMSGGIGIAGFKEPRGEKGILLDDVRVFSRAFRTRETEQYADTFNSHYNPVAVKTAVWCGPSGSSDIFETANWFCINSVGERVVSLPGEDTDVVVSGKSIPSIPPKSNFACKSFTIDGWAVVEDNKVDLRGVKVVTLSDNARIITKGAGAVAVNALKGRRMRLDGKLAVLGGMELSGGLELKGGSVLRLMAGADRNKVKSLVVKDGDAVIAPGVATVPGRTSKIMLIDEAPSDFSHLRLKPDHGPKDADFKIVQNKYLGVVPRK